jgi:hypothetical protein
LGRRSRLGNVFSIPALSSGLAKDELDLGVKASQLIFGPKVQFIHQFRRKSQEKWFSLSQSTNLASEDPERTNKLRIERSGVDHRMHVLVPA